MSSKILWSSLSVLFCQKLKYVMVFSSHKAWNNNKVLQKQTDPLVVLLSKYSIESLCMSSYFELCTIVQYIGSNHFELCTIVHRNYLGT
jgi:hypothetical protein